VEVDSNQKMVVETTKEVVMEDEHPSPSTHRRLHSIKGLIKICGIYMERYMPKTRRSPLSRKEQSTKYNIG
jgi:hypothetical protein